MRIKILLTLTCFVLVGLIAGGVSACGGFFCTTTPIDQSAERIIFTVNGDGTISAYVGINYTGAAEDFSWVVPVPSPPELDVAETQSLDTLQNVTNPRFTNPPNHCDGIAWAEGGGGGGGGDFLEEGHVGPYDYAIIASDNPLEIINWLRDNGYQVTPEMEPIIMHYVNAGMYFLAMKLSQDAEVGDIQPVKMTYNSIDPMVPIRLTAVAAVQDMPIIVWIFGQEPYSPQNFAHPDVDFASFRAPSKFSNPFGFANPVNQYFNERNRIQDEYDGKAFITEYAMPSINLLELSESVAQDVLLPDLINRYPFVTRLRAQMSPEQMTLDPVFVPDSTQHHVPQTVDLSEYVDPLHYWGCSTREFQFEDIEANLPNQTLIDERVSFRYPANWVRSETTFNGVPLEVFAPRAVTTADIEAFIARTAAFPMLLRPMIDLSQYRYPSHRDVLKLPSDFEFGEGLTFFSFGYSDLFTGGEFELMFILLTTRTDWQLNEQKYILMGTYLNSYLYASHLNLRNTLALADAPPGFAIATFPPMQIGFPEGWTEFLQENNDVIIVPDDGSSLRVDIYPMDLRLPDELFADFEITDETRAMVDEFRQTSCHLPTIPYEVNGRKGFLRSVSGYVVTVSAVPAEFDANAEVLQWIADSVFSYPGLCG